MHIYFKLVNFDIKLDLSLNWNLKRCQCSKPLGFNVTFTGMTTVHPKVGEKKANCASKFSTIMKSSKLPSQLKLECTIYGYDMLVFYTDENWLNSSTEFDLKL